MKELKKVVNKLLNREELLLEFLVNKSSTISKDKVIEEISKKYSVKKELILINKIESFFKSNKNIVDVFIYKNEKDLNDLTLKYLKKRNSKEEEKAEENKTEASERAKPEEKKEEEKTEEEKEEEKNE